MIKALLCLTLLVIGVLPGGIGAAHAQDTAPRPPALQTLLSAEPEEDLEEQIQKQNISLRRQALKNAALSYGARGGLARRNYEIRQQIRHKAHYMDKTYNFNRLLIRGPSGVLIEPPIVTEGQDAMLIKNNGQTAAITELMLTINQNARIVPIGRNWRDYLEREWGEVKPPPDLLLPQNDEERAIWRKYVRRGWEEGYNQAEEIFQADLDRLSSHFQGMVRYRMLLKQNMISAPFALLEERGVTGGGNELRVGDRAVQITGPSQLNVRASEWLPASR